MQGLGRAGMGKSWDGPGNGPTPSSSLPRPPCSPCYPGPPTPFSSNTSLAGGHSGWKCLLKYHLYILGIFKARNVDALG